MERKKLGVPALAGLLVGPVLGSGVILLPPLALEGAGSASVAAWVVTLGIMGVFAGVTAALCLRYPGDGGLTEAVGAAFGPGAREACGWLLLGAVCFGPAAVLLTAGQYLARAFPVPGGEVGGAVLLLLLALGLLLRRVTFVGTLALGASTLIGAVLFAGSLGVLLHPAPVVPLPPPSPLAFGRVLVLLFWAVIGWEILGNYTGEIENPRRTVPRAAGLAFGAVTGIYLVLVTALPRAAASGGGLPSLADLLRPLFGGAAEGLLALLGTLLCLCTYLMVVGGVARLGVSMAERGRLPRFLGTRNAQGAPAAAAATLCGIHALGLGATALGAVDVAFLVGAANGLFLLNALLVVAAGARLLPGRPSRWASGFLALCFGGLFCLADRGALLAVAAALLLSLLDLSPRRAVAPRPCGVLPGGETAEASSGA